MYLLIEFGSSIFLLNFGKIINRADPKLWNSTNETQTHWLYQNFLRWEIFELQSNLCREWHQGHAIHQLHFYFFTEWWHFHRMVTKMAWKKYVTEDACSLVFIHQNSQQCWRFLLVYEVVPVLEILLWFVVLYLPPCVWHQKEKGKKKNLDHHYIEDHKLIGWSKQTTENNQAMIINWTDKIWLLGWFLT